MSTSTGSIDGYNRQSNPDFAQSQIALVFYTDPVYLNSGKPLMIGETGALTAASNGSEIQQPYLQSAETKFPTLFPRFKAFVYFSAGGNNGDWTLDSSGNRAVRQHGGERLFFSSGGGRRSWCAGDHGPACLPKRLRRAPVRTFATAASGTGLTYQQVV